MTDRHTRPLRLDCLFSFDERYILGSSRYGDYVHLPEGQYDDTFLEAAEDGYAQGLLHDLGHLAIDKATNQLVFLITERLAETAHITEADLEELERQCGGPAQLLQMPNNGISDPAFPVIVMPLTRVDQFKDAPTFSSLISALLG